MLRKTSSIFATFWATDRGLSIFLTLLLVFVFLLPPLKPLIPVRWSLSEIFFAMLLISGVAAVSRRRWHAIVMLTIVFAAMLVELANGIAPSTKLEMWNSIGRLAVLGLFTFVVLAQVFRAGAVTRDRILGAVAAYLLFGLTWAAAYHLVALRNPDAFAGAVPKGSEHISGWVYFSYVTLTTVGYGDITPVAMVARTLSNMESLTGQLYPAILIARLVSLELLHRSENHAPAGDDAKSNVSQTKG